MQSLCQSLFLAKLQAFTMNDNDEFVADSMIESVFSLRLWGSLFLVKVWGHSYKHESFTMNDKEEVCAGVCFGEASGFY